MTYSGRHLIFFAAGNAVCSVPLLLVPSPVSRRGFFATFRPAYGFGAIVGSDLPGGASSLLSVRGRLGIFFIPAYLFGIILAGTCARIGR